MGAKEKGEGKGEMEKERVAMNSLGRLGGAACCRKAGEVMGGRGRKEGGRGMEAKVTPTIQKSAKGCFKLEISPLLFQLSRKVQGKLEDFFKFPRKGGL